MQSKVTMFGHPVHPMLVAYPVAFNTATLFGYSAYGATADQFWLRFAIVANIGAVGMALVAALPGFIDWWLAIPRGTEAKRTGVNHMLLNYGSLILFAVALAMYAPEWNQTLYAGAMAGIILCGAGIGFTILAGFQGWKLVQDHHVGVKVTPEQYKIDMNRELRRAG